MSEMIQYACLNFNPHHREGGDKRLLDRHNNNQISIHTTAKVVTTILLFHMGILSISIHTTAKVVTSSLPLQGVHMIISIHTTAKVVTISILLMAFISPISIHTTAKVVTAKMPKFHSYFCIKLLINRLFHTNLTTPFPSIPPFSITQHPKIWCESPNVFLFTSYSH